MKPGLFITVEGTEGAGKSTNLSYIHDLLMARGINVVLTREPGGTPVGEKIREVLLQSQNKMAHLCELLLLFAARAQHIEQVIAPALAQGRWVLCDRFTDATYAYQGGGRGIDSALIEKLEQMVQGDLKPHFTVLLDVPVEVGQSRLNTRPSLDRFEQEHTAFFQRIRENYLNRARDEPQRFRLIDASLALPEVQAALGREIASIMNRHKID